MIGRTLRSLRSSKWTLDRDTDTLVPLSFDVSDVNEYTSFLAAFHASCHQGLLRMYSERRSNGTADVFRGGEGIVRKALMLVRAKVRRLQRDDGGCEEDGEGWEVEGGLELFYAVREKRREHDRRQAKAYKGVAGAGATSKRLGAVCAVEVGGVATSVAAEAEDDEVAGRRCEEDDGFDREVREAVSELKAVDPQWCVEGEQSVWIAKANSGSKAVGIKLFDTLTNLTEMSGKGRVYQKYIERPLLIQGRKFDIRCWVLVTDWSQLSVWFYDHCLLRFCSDRWDLSQIKNRTSHLSNVCVNNREGGEEDSPGGTGRSLDTVWHSSRFDEHLGGGVWRAHVLPSIKDIVVVALRTAQSEIKARKASFELYGFDVMLDEVPS